MKDIQFLNRVYITVDDIENFYNLREYPDLVKIVISLVEKGDIIPIKPKDTNGKHPALCKKYKVITKKIDETPYLEELRTELPPSFSIDYYRRNVDKYIQHQKYILALSNYFKFNKSLLFTKASINERSFEIWGEEKFLKDNPLAKMILKNLGLTIEQLNVYKTPEPFFYYTNEDAEKQNILIIENKDTWYTMRELLREGQTDFFGVSIGTIVYGEGKKILHGFTDLENNNEACFTNPKNAYYYFGDIDYEGAFIYVDLKRQAEGYRDVVLFKEAYDFMVGQSNGFKLPRMKENQAGKKDFEQFINELNPISQAQVRTIIESGCYIPQEIANYRLLHEKRG